MRLIAVLVSVIVSVMVTALAASAAVAQQPPAKREIVLEYREAAELRALEKQELALCQTKAGTAKVLVRDRAKFIIECLDAK